MRFHTLRGGWFLAILCGLVGLQLKTSAEELKLSPRHVSVTGTAVTRVQPDTVLWQITVRRTHRELPKAQSANNAAVEKVLDLRSDLKIKAEDAQTGYLSVQKVFDRDTAGNQTSFRHFDVTRTISLRQKNTKNFDEVLAKLMEADVEVSYQLEASEFHKQRVQTRLAAVQAAREKATAMTQLLGAKIGRVLRIAEPHDNYLAPSISNSMSFAPRQAEPDTAPGTFAPGAIEISVSIEVDFEIE